MFANTIKIFSLIALITTFAFIGCAAQLFAESFASTNNTTATGTSLANSSNITNTP